MRKDGIIYGSIVMILINFIIRTIGFIYGIILSKLLGAEALGHIQIANSTLMSFLVLTTAGIPTSITKLVAEENSKKNHKEVASIFNSTIIFNLLFSIILSIILMFSAEFISIKVFKNSDMLIGVYLLVPALIIISISNIIRSYFYGMKNMITPSVSQVVEHITRFVIVLGMLYYFKPKSPIHGAIIAIAGISIGEFFDLLWSLSSKRRLYKHTRSSSNNNVFSLSSLSKVLTISLPLTISGFFNIILMFLNTLIIPARLISSGYTNSESIAIYGRIMGMTMPLITLPFIVTSALVINMITSLSEKMALKKTGEMRRDIGLSIKITLLVSIPLMVLFVSLSKPLAIFLYSDPLVADYIHIMGYSTVLFALHHTLSGILYGLGKQTVATVNRLVGMVLRVVLLYILMGNPNIGVNGFFISFFVSNAIIIFFDIIILKTVIDLHLNYLDIIGKPLIASLFMVAFIYLSSFDLNNLANSSPVAFAFTFIAAAIAYVFVLILTEAIPKQKS